jgi:hypothetical protein
VVVIWEDAAFSNDDTSPEQVDCNSVTNHTAGWLLKRTKKHTVLVWDVAPLEEQNTVRSPYTIINSLIRGIIYTGIHGGDTKWPS